ncbi:DinB family protein [Rhodococcus sp. 1R11]|uniref:DinB family protein n=1 Tax=Rhodococcus sp. 1R11 TaxID=2559614 RepID=UPI00107276CB|nr:DinB family protein [Rhodococcus sp. 1R11]TFI44134.1 DinB family protein [Rhodococcus sp. 1R11]
MTDRCKTWTAPTPDPVDGPLVGADRPILEGMLRWHRATLLNICAGADAEQLARRPFASSSLSLAGLVRHLTKVERIWFRERLASMTFDPMFDPALGKDSDFLGACASSAEADFAGFAVECAASDEVASRYSFDDVVRSRGEPMSLRMVYIHMVGEYARHNGHADIVREQIDGVTGR